jgi:hypothetical protein
VARPAGVFIGRRLAAKLAGYGLFGHSQPSLQLAQQSHSHLQSGQPSQQSSEQHSAPLAQQVPALAGLGSFELDDVPAMPAAIRPAATTRPPNNFINMTNSLSDSK